MITLTRLVYKTKIFLTCELPYGIYNLRRYFRLVWEDRDWDWDYLAAFMEFKLRNMAVTIGDNGFHVGRERTARDIRICANLLKRLRKDDYWENAKIRFGANGIAGLHAQNQQKNDQKYLGVLIGKYLNHWWD